MTYPVTVSSREGDLQFILRTLLNHQLQGFLLLHDLVAPTLWASYLIIDGLPSALVVIATMPHLLNHSWSQLVDLDPIT